MIVQQGDVSLPGYFFICQNEVQHECGSSYVCHIYYAEFRTAIEFFQKPETPLMNSYIFFHDILERC